MAPTHGHRGRGMWKSGVQCSWACGYACGLISSEQASSRSCLYFRQLAAAQPSMLLSRTRHVETQPKLHKLLCKDNVWIWSGWLHLTHAGHAGRASKRSPNSTAALNGYRQKASKKFSIRQQCVYRAALEVSVLALLFRPGVMGWTQRRRTISLWGRPAAICLTEAKVET